MWNNVNHKRKNQVSQNFFQIMVFTTLNTDRHTANVLANYFISVCITEKDEDPPVFDKIDNRKKNKFRLHEVFKLLKNQNFKVSGSKQYSSKEFKWVNSSPYPPCKIFDISSPSGAAPEGWKTRLPAALFKKKDNKSAASYWPVSLTGMLYRMLEELIRKRMTKHIKNHLLLDKKCGFLSSRSTTQQLLKVLDHWTKILDKGKIINAVYMNFIKRFNKVRKRKKNTI